jgi:hypothetical protein
MNMTLNEIVNDLPISELTNTPESPFWWRGTMSEKFTERFPHETAKVGQAFFDGNNGDRWIVRAANTENQRLIVENTTQGGMRLVFWN